ncbi:unnamed protein product [Cylicocyclus nassatus]|uniref:FtsK gamma domain-containing protein n=1 Tax=Cylicocyclus nassatus TaxID=53992 RepID=A0AA36DRD5_CYLNA|nr:unnamed protein product [Cylicocyclus nassatus]
MASSGAKNIAENRVTYFNDMGYDPKALEDASDTIRWMVQGATDYIGDAKNWNEGFIGALTGLLGMPARRIRNWGGGIIGEVQQAKAEKVASQKAADTLNKLVNSDKFQNDWRGYIRHLAYDDQMLEATQNDDKYAWHTANDNQLISDVLMFADAGKLDDLYEFIDSQASININDKDAIDKIRAFLRKTKEDDNIVLANETDEKILERIKEQAKDMKDTVDTYRKVFEDLASVAPTDVNSEKFKEMMFTTMQLHKFEERFISTLNKTEALVSPALRARSVVRADGTIETDENRLKENFQLVKEQFHQAMAGNVKTSIMDYLSEAELNAWLDNIEEDLKAQEKKLTGEAADNTSKAIKALQDMRKMAEGRRSLLRKIVSLRKMTNEEYKAQSKIPETVVEQAEQADTKQETTNLKSVDDVRVELLKRSGNKEKSDYIKELKKIRSSNKAVDEYFKIQELKNDYNKVKKEQRALPTTTLAMETRIVERMFNTGQSVDDILSMREELIPSLQELIDDLKDHVTVFSGGNSRPDLLEACRDEAIQHVTDIINGLRRARKLTAIARAASAEVPPVDDPIADAFDREGKPAPSDVDAPPPASEAPTGTGKPATPAPAPASEVPDFLKPEPADTSDLEPPVITTPPDLQGESTTEGKKVEKAIEAATQLMPRQYPDEDGYARNDGIGVGFYNTAVPEIAPRSRNALIEKNKQRKFGDIAKMKIEMLPDELPGYEETWRWLKDHGAFETMDTVSKGDKVFFVIDPIMEEYDGEPQILLCTGTRENPQVFNILRKSSPKDKPWKGLSELRADILKEYGAHRNGNNSNSKFVYSKNSTVWVPGYSENAPIIAIGKNDEIIPVRGKVNPDLLEAFKSKLMFDASPDSYRGNLYYLANGEIAGVGKGYNMFIPIRLNVEHYNPDTADNSGYAFDQVNACYEKLVDMARKFAEDPEKYDKDAKDAVLKELNKYLDIHGMNVSFGLMAGKLPVVSLYSFADNYANGTYKRDSKPTLFGQIPANSITAETLKEFFSTISTPTDEEGHTKEMLNNGLLTTNADSLRALGADVYFEPYNPETGKFENGHTAEEIAGDPPVAEAPIAAETCSCFRALEFIKGRNIVSTSLLQKYLSLGYARAARIIDKLEAEGLIVAKASPTGKFLYQDLTHDQKKALEAQGVDEQLFDELPLSDQEVLLRCA